MSQAEIATDACISTAAHAVGTHIGHYLRPRTNKLIHRLASVILLSYNSSDDLRECIPTIISQTYANREIIVVDNASTDKTPEIVGEKYPDIKVVQTGANLGYSAGNNLGSMHAKGEYLVVANPDTVADPEWVSQLIKPLEEHPEIAVTTSKILIYNQDRINTCANCSHFTGLDFCRGLNEPSRSYQQFEEVGSISGCSFAIRKEVFDNIGGFDPDFFLYMEDVDLSWRIRLAGHKIVYVPNSIIYHKYKLSVPPWKEFYLEKNRYTMLLKCYSMRMLLLISPSLVVSEVLSWGFAALHGWAYIVNKAWAYIWVIRNLNEILEKRHRVQATRKVKDKEFIRFLSWKIPFEQLIKDRTIAHIADITFNTFYRVNFEIIKKMICYN